MSQSTDGGRRQLIQAMAAQQRVLETQDRKIAALREGLSLLAHAAGVAQHPRVARLLKAAADENPAQPEGWANTGTPGAEAPSETTEQAAAPEARTDVTSDGATPVTEVAPDAQTSLDGGGTVLEESLDLNEQDVTAPVAGTEEIPPASETKIETDVRAGTPDDNSNSMFPLQGPFAEKATAAKQEGDGRFFATQRLARLRIQAGIADEETDDLMLGQAIARSELSDADISREIDTLEKVVTAKGRSTAQPARTAARGLVPTGTGGVQRTMPSMASPASTDGIQASASVDGIGEDELAFE